MKFFSFLPEFESDGGSVHIAFNFNVYCVVEEAFTFIFFGIGVIDHGDIVDEVLIIRDCWRSGLSFFTRGYMVAAIGSVIRFRSFERSVGIGCIVGLHWR